MKFMNNIIKISNKFHKFIYLQNNIIYSQLKNYLIIFIYGYCKPSNLKTYDVSSFVGDNPTLEIDKKEMLSFPY